MKPWKRTLFIVLALITILSLIFSACELIDNGNGNSDNSNGNGKGKDKEGRVTICHKTGIAKNPYVEITVSNNATADGHATHEGDIIPAPEGGCPAE